MSANKTESFNILLIIFSLILSFIFPFELFLFSYAVLGPLHYCTEISWLHDKNYFTKDKVSIIPLFILGFLFVFTVNYISSHHTLVTVVFFCITISFFFSFFLIYHFDIRYSLFVFLTVGILSVFVLYIPIFKIIFYYFLATLIHVYVFTGLFMLSGNLKRNNLLGHIGFCFFILAPFICLLIPVQPQHLYDYFKNNYLLIMSAMITDNFKLLNIALTQDTFFENEWVIKVSRFISFAYTYHYLNWFSKTKIIGWHNVSTRRRIIILTVWIVSLLCYAYNYMIGYQILLFLSIVHVFLEFPLNWISILSILKIKTH